MAIVDTMILLDEGDSDTIKHCVCGGGGGRASLKFIQDHWLWQYYYTDWPLCVYATIESSIRYSEASKPNRYDILQTELSIV